MSCEHGMAASSRTIGWTSAAKWVASGCFGQQADMLPLARGVGTMGAVAGFGRPGELLVDGPGQ
eukprot:15434424-Alexandrium_andersonii.AAC.1